MVFRVRKENGEFTQLAKYIGVFLPIAGVLIAVGQNMRTTAENTKDIGTQGIQIERLTGSVQEIATRQAVDRIIDSVIVVQQGEMIRKLDRIERKLQR